jgi:sugar (pentulose or hexulose) kinase
LLTGNACSDVTSIGCHTAMWDFDKNRYHEWIQHEGLAIKLPSVIAANKVLPALFPGNKYKVGIGLHDSSAALIPYLINFHEPFVLISTGTWCISLNPFNDSPLTNEQLSKDCLRYLQYQGKAVKASRVFSGFEHEQQVKRIATHFKQNIIKYRNVDFDANIIADLKQNSQDTAIAPGDLSAFASRDLASFKSDIVAYHQLMLDLIDLQLTSTRLILNGKTVKRIFVDGGFSKNSIYMHLLALAFPEMEIFAASMAQATAVGAALAIHNEWNRKAIPNDIIQLKYYSASQMIAI